MPKRLPLSKFETAAQYLVEGSFNRLFGGQIEQLDIAVRLARAMEDSLQAGQVADVYTVRLNPADLDGVQKRHPNLQVELKAYLTNLAQQTGIALPVQPTIVVTADVRIGRHRVEVDARTGEQAVHSTTQLQQAGGIVEKDVMEALRSLDAYLIVNGRHHVPLDKPIVAIGRRTDNDIVLDVATVSRQHAQIRWRYGRFILYDLSNRGRTVVNGQPISECALKPGDVIALSTVMLIYGEGQTQPGRPPAPRPSGADEATQLRPPGET